MIPHSQTQEVGGSATLPCYNCFTDAVLVAGRPVVVDGAQHTRGDGGRQQEQQRRHATHHRGTAQLNSHMTVHGVTTGTPVTGELHI